MSTLSSITRAVKAILSWVNKKATWQILNEKGKSALTFTTMLDFEIRTESQIVNSAIEEGSFTSYNKVFSPDEVMVTLGMTGTTSEIKSAIRKLDDLQLGLDLVSLVTPETEIRQLNLTSYNYRRTASEGACALWVDLTFKEVREVEAEYTSVTLQETKNRGKVQTSTASSSSSDSSENNSSILSQITGVS